MLRENSCHKIGRILNAFWVHEPIWQHNDPSLPFWRYMQLRTLHVSNIKNPRYMQQHDSQCLQHHDFEISAALPTLCVSNIKNPLYMQQHDSQCTISRYLQRYKLCVSATSRTFDMCSIATLNICNITNSQSMQHYKLCVSATCRTLNIRNITNSVHRLHRELSTSRTLNICNATNSR